MDTPTDRTGLAPRSDPPSLGRANATCTFVTTWDAARAGSTNGGRNITAIRRWILPIIPVLRTRRRTKLPTRSYKPSLRFAKLGSGGNHWTRYGQIGPRVIQVAVGADLQIDPFPVSATIQRILQAQGLTHPIGAGNDSAYYPWPMAWAVNAIHATDIITRHIRGGEENQNFHTLDHYSHAVRSARNTPPNECDHLRASA